MAKKKLSTAEKEKTRIMMMKFRLEAEEGNKSTFVRMTENERFKIGKQWDHDDHSFNEDAGKFCLTINEVLPIILDIAGTQQENPLDYKVRNVKGGTQVVAAILTSLTKNVMDKSMGQEESSRSFESGVTTARGFLHIDVDYANDPLNGDFKIVELDPFMVLPDPTCKKYDYNSEDGGAKYIIIDHWEDKEKMIAMYPKEQLEDASFNFSRETMFGRFRGMLSHMFGSGPDLHLKDDYRQHDDDIDDDLGKTSKQVYNFKVSDYWWKKWVKGIYLQKLDDPLNYLALTDPEEISQARKLAKDDPNLKIIDKDRNENPLTIAILNKTIMIGDKLLEHIEDPYNGMNLYLTNRFAPYFDHGYEYPPVQNLISPQKLINFSFSTVVNILKNLANTGYKIASGSEAAKEWLEDHGMQDGVIIDESKYGGRVEKIEATPLPVGHHIIAEVSKQNMRDVSQVQLTQPVKKSPESGKAKQIDELRTLRTKGIIFRNWNQTNRLVARVLVELIRNTNIFSDDEILAIVDEDDLMNEDILDQARGIILNQVQEMGGNIPPQPEQPNPIRMLHAEPEQQAQMLDAFQEEMKLYAGFIEKLDQAARPLAQDIVLKLLRQMQQGRYGIKIDTSPMAPTMRIARSLELQELNRSLIDSGQPGISRTQLIEASDAPNKDELIAEIPQVQGVA